MLSNDVTCAASATLGTQQVSLAGSHMRRYRQSRVTRTNCRKGVVTLTRGDKGKRNIIHAALIPSACGNPGLSPAWQWGATVRNPYLFMGLETHACKAEQLIP